MSNPQLELKEVKRDGVITMAAANQAKQDVALANFHAAYDREMDKVDDNPIRRLDAARKLLAEFAQVPETLSAAVRGGELTLKTSVKRPAEVALSELNGAISNYNEAIETAKDKLDTLNTFYSKLQQIRHDGIKGEADIGPLVAHTKYFHVNFSELSSAFNDLVNAGRFEGKTPDSIEKLQTEGYAQRGIINIQKMLPPLLNRQPALLGDKKAAKHSLQIAIEGLVDAFEQKAVTVDISRS